MDPEDLPTTVPDIVVQLILRHVNLNSTVIYYIKAAADEVRECYDGARKPNRRGGTSPEGHYGGTKLFGARCAYHELIRDK